MTADRDELREQLLAVIEAAPELPKEGRKHLADVFFDRLSAEYDLVPRGTGTLRRPGGPPGKWGRRPPWVPIVLALAFLLFVVPAAIHHFPIFLLILLIVFFAARKARSHRSPTGAAR
jgi:hypothetical protein